MGRCKVRGPFPCICTISFLPLMQIVWELRSTNFLSHSPHPSPTRAFPKTGWEHLSFTICPSSHFSAKGVSLALVCLLVHEPPDVLDLPGGPSSRDTKAALPTPGSETFWSAHMQQLPEYFTGLMKVGRGTKCKRPKPQAWGGSLWKKEGELQLCSSIIQRLRCPGGYPAGLLSGRRFPATSVLHLHGSRRHSICPLGWANR